MNPPPTDVRKILNEAVLHTVKAHGFSGQVVDLAEGDEIEVLCTPAIPVPGARFFLRSELLVPPAAGTNGPATASVPTPILLCWRSVAEPVAVVGLDPETGGGRLGEIHPFLTWLDRNRAGWESTPTVSVPLPRTLDGKSLPILARAAADGHVLYRRVLDQVRRGGREVPPQDLRMALVRIQVLDFDATVACLDLLREAGLVEESQKRELKATEACTAAYSRAAVQHAVSARGHADPVSAGEAGRSAVVRILQSRLPDVAESTLARCAVVLARFLPVEDTDAILDLATDPEALGEAIGG